MASVSSVGFFSQWNNKPSHMLGVCVCVCVAVHDDNDEHTEPEPSGANNVTHIYRKTAAYRDCRAAAETISMLRNDGPKHTSPKSVCACVFLD